MAVPVRRAVRVGRPSRSLVVLGGGQAQRRGGSQGDRGQGIAPERGRRIVQEADEDRSARDVWPDVWPDVRKEDTCAAVGSPARGRADLGRRRAGPAGRRRTGQAARATVTSSGRAPVAVNGRTRSSSAGPAPLLRSAAQAPVARPRARRASSASAARRGERPPGMAPAAPVPVAATARLADVIPSRSGPSVWARASYQRPSAAR